MPDFDEILEDVRREYNNYAIVVIGMETVGDVTLFVFDAYSEDPTQPERVNRQRRFRVIDAEGNTKVGGGTEIEFDVERP